jgi:hypothetical protein
MVRSAHRPANQWGWIDVPGFPSDDDWGLKLILAVP